LMLHFKHSFARITFRAVLVKIPAGCRNLSSLVIFQVRSNTYYIAIVNFDNIKLDFYTEGTYNYSTLNACTWCDRKTKPFTESKPGHSADTFCGGE
ncbi:MAG: hypothetical protein KJP07_06605, partial [Desulfatitalea sp.]|nr:hypothetical protein [Desulfatitalea sp.]